MATTVTAEVNAKLTPLGANQAYKSLACSLVSDQTVICQVGQLSELYDHLVCISTTVSGILGPLPKWARLD